MKSLRGWLLIIAFMILAFSARAVDYPLGPDSKPQPGVPQGMVLKFTLPDSKIFPGSRHEYWVYVPAEYTADNPACVYVGQDGIGFQATNVFDNLIYKKEMPVTIGVFVKPGVLYAADTNGALDRFNRSYEYDGLGDNYARFLLEEILPAVEKITLPDGRAVRLSHDGNDRAIAGQSSGGICAFTVAWERPHEFSRVFSAIGTYVDLRGGWQYPTLVRKFEPKPLRVFLQDGTNDNNKYGGDWWMANQAMERALTFSGYEVNHTWGEDIHSSKQGNAIFPDVMRWLWKDWPQPVKGRQTLNDTLTNILIPGEDWQLVAESLAGSDGPAANAKGDVFFSEAHSTRIWQITTAGERQLYATNGANISGTAFGPDGNLYAVGKHAQSIHEAANVRALAWGMMSDIHGNDLVVAHNGNIYMTDSTAATTNGPTTVWLIDTNNVKTPVDSGLRFANGITLSPDQSLLYVTDYRSHWVYSFAVQPDGTLADKERYFALHQRDADDDSGADGIRVDRDGRLYVSTRLGIQVCDQAGRVQCIIPVPAGRVTNLCFGGEKFDTLFATCGEKVYKRKLNVTGANAWAEPNKPIAPKM